jgi:hypothetical protein
MIRPKTSLSVSIALAIAFMEKLRNQYQKAAPMRGIETAVNAL